EQIRRVLKMEKIKNYLLDNMDELRQVVSEINSWDGSLESLDVYENDEEIFNVYFEGRPMEAVRAAQYGEYRYTDEYVRFNGYGNVERMSEYDYNEEIAERIDDIVDELIDKRSHLYLSDELEELLDELLGEEEDDEE